MAAALRQGAIMNSGNGSCVVSNQEEQNTTTLENTVDVAIEKFNTTIEKIVDTAIERRLATAVEEVIANISNSFEQLISPINSSHTVMSCRTETTHYSKETLCNEH